jgi:hypothetical protein
MSDLAIVVAESQEALQALADEQGLTLIAGTSKAFDTLCTHRTPAMADVGDIDTGSPGWVALATVD